MGKSHSLPYVGAHVCKQSIFHFVLSLLGLCMFPFPLRRWIHCNHGNLSGSGSTSSLFPVGLSREVALPGGIFMNDPDGLSKSYSLFYSLKEEYLLFASVVFQDQLLQQPTNQSNITRFIKGCGDENSFVLCPLCRTTLSFLIL